MVSFVGEGFILSLIGGAIGCLLASLTLDGVTTSSTNFNTVSEITYNFHVTFPLIVAALSLSGGLGILGGILPARTAAKQTIVDALRSA